MDKIKCEKCKNYFVWTETSLEVDGNGLYQKKEKVNEICCKINKDITQIKRCNCCEVIETETKPIAEEKPTKVKTKKQK